MHESPTYTKLIFRGIWSSRFLSVEQLNYAFRGRRAPPLPIQSGFREHQRPPAPFDSPASTWPVTQSPPPTASVARGGPGPSQSKVTQCRSCLECSRRAVRCRARSAAPFGRSWPRRWASPTTDRPPAAIDPGYMRRINEFLERINSIRETSESFNLGSSCKRPDPSRFHKLDESKLMFGSRIEIIRSELPILLLM